MSQPGTPAIGRMQPSDGSTDWTAADFHIRQILRYFRTASPVQVKKVTGGDTAGTGTVDVQPLVNLVDGDNQFSDEHGIITGLPFWRLQTANGGVIDDPVVGDIGLAIIADRDISAVKTSKATANPGSFRSGDFADGLYLGSFLTGAITQYIKFTQTGIIVAAPMGMEVDGDLTTTGNLSAGNGVTGSFMTATGQIVTVQNGIVTGIA